MEDLLNLVRREVSRMLNLQARDRIGIVDSYDPDRHSVKVRYQPENTLSGWLPVGSLMAGNGYGVFFAPTPGDQVEVGFQGGVHEAGIVRMRLFSTTDQPLSVPSGEMWAIHQSGSGWKFHNDGTGEIIAASDLTLTVGGDLNVNVAGDYNLNVTGDVNAQATQFSLTGPLTSTDDITANGISVDTHKHTGVQTGSGDTGGPV